MVWGIAIIIPDGTKFEKVLEELIYPADIVGKKLITKETGIDRFWCLSQAAAKFGGMENFLNNVDYIRKFEPNGKYASTHPTIIEFYK